jgi:hypothetical protein
MKTSNSLGEKQGSKLEVGDIVSWKKLNKKSNIGLIYNIYNTIVGGRQVKKASIVSLVDTLPYDMLVLELKLISQANGK